MGGVFRGQSISSIELENILSNYPGVLAAAVVARYKRPKGYTFLTLPRNASGKIIKGQLRQLIRNS